ncbi:mesothelin-like protein [Apus apus]|uniref:mesothelin-like protein n=1 Tax=Apus apus TaxID=8895 RepID=UPI0021F8B012|nr:mesothelin-like protein [Apus apus]
MWLEMRGLSPLFRVLAPSAAVTRDVFRFPALLPRRCRGAVLCTVHESTGVLGTGGRDQFTLWSLNPPRAAWAGVFHSVAGAVLGASRNEPRPVQQDQPQGFNPANLLWVLAQLRSPSLAETTYLKAFLDLVTLTQMTKDARGFSTDLAKVAVATLIIGAVLSAAEQHPDLGALVCDMEPETITASDPSVLENLKLCPELTGAQQDALNAVLLGGGTVYGDPSSWDLQTLQSLGPLVLALNQTTLSLVAKATREAFGRTIAATYSSQGHSQWEKSLTLLRAFPAAVALSRPRLKRTTEGEEETPDMSFLPTGCSSSPITASTISTLLVLTYSIEEFNLCLSDEVLKANLELLSEQPLPTTYLRVLKRKLSQIYPSGIPEKQLKELGTLSRLYTPKEISQWMVTSSDTLLALLDPSDGQWNPAQVNQLLKRYRALGGTLMGSTLTGPLLQTIGGRNLCNLQEEQIDKIPLESIRTAGQLNISSCSQTKKDQLYRKAHEVFGDKAESTSVYYCHIWPYLGGAPADDLKSLAKRGTAINMDMGTFLNLNPKELQKLSIMDVKNLLGKNLHYLKAAENETVVVDWVKRQSQQELDCILGIGLQGGMVEPNPTGTHTPPHPTASASTTDLVPMPTTLTTAPIPSASSSKATPPGATLLTTLLTAVKSNTTSPSSVPPAAHGTTTPSVGTNPAVTFHNTSTPLVSMSPPAPGGTTHPTPATHSTITLSTHNPPSTPAPNSTSPPATSTATEINLSPHKPTLIPSSTISTQKSVVSSVAETTTLPCTTSAPPAPPSPSSTTTSSETTEKTPTAVPETPRPTPDGYIHVVPEAGSGSRPSSCLVPILVAALGSSLLWGLL